MSKDTRDPVAAPLHVLITEKLYAPEESAGPFAIVLEGSTICTLWRVADEAQARQLCAERMPGQAVEVSNLGTWHVAPGYIDIHIHGLRGHDITTGPQEDIAAITHELPQFGVTSFFPTIATNGKEETRAQIKRIVGIAECQANERGAEILGIRLEGPFISHAKKGAQYEPGIRRPDTVEMSELAAIGQGRVRIVDYAPEEDEGDRLLAMLVRLGILPCIGHTMATYEQALHAIDGGARHSTHLFNAMPSLGHREPGSAGALLTDHRATVEMIADGIHLHPAMLRLIFACRGVREVALITDAVAAAGLPDGEHEFINRKVRIAHGSVRLADGTLAGSGLTLDRAVRNMVAFTGMNWAEAIRMASLTPAEITGVAERKGKVAPGMDADLIALDEQGCVRRTWVRGQLVYSSDSNASM
ncbi:MAG TPA: N-acetylglucosamine-6-phosphate deacetylase [Ktedonobacteraceae bacterium]|jgi:N-acetylglucosamine-6-phosphate deacetylase